MMDNARWVCVCVYQMSFCKYHDSMLFICHFDRQLSRAAKKIDLNICSIIILDCPANTIHTKDWNLGALLFSVDLTLALHLFFVILMLLLLKMRTKKKQRCYTFVLFACELDDDRRMSKPFSKFLIAFKSSKKWFGTVFFAWLFLSISTFSQD